MGILVQLVLTLVRPYVVIRERRHAITPAEQRAGWRYVLLSPAAAVLALLLWVAERFMGSWSPGWRHAEAGLFIAALAAALFSWFAMTRLAWKAEGAPCLRPRPGPGAERALRPATARRVDSPVGCW